MKKLILPVLLAVFALGLIGAGCTVANQPLVGVNIPNQPVSATSLDLSNKGLTAVPKYVFGMTGLTELNLSHNNLTGAIPGEIRFLKNLKTLDLSYNQMTGVPAEVGQLSNLVTLNLSHNQLTGLPNELGNLKNLKTLNLSGNNCSPQDVAVIQKGLAPTCQIIK